MLLQETSKRFLDHCRSITNLSSHSIRAYEGDLNDALSFFGNRKRLASVKKDDLRSYIHHLRAERELKETTIKRRLATVKLLFKWAAHEEMLTETPFSTFAERIRLPKRLPRALDRSDRALLRKAVETHRRMSDFDTVRTNTIIHLLMETGIRVGELVAIERKDLSMADACVLIHGKGNRQRLAYIAQRSLRQALKRYLELRSAIGISADHLFVTSNGRPLSTAAVRRELHQFARNAGLTRRVTPHMLRHTCATAWLECGLDIRHVQKLLGHHSISTTEIYTHVSDQSLREALLRATKGGMRDN